MKPCLVYRDEARTHLMSLLEGVDNPLRAMVYVSACGDATSYTTRYGFPNEVDCTNCRKSALYQDFIQ